MRGTAPSIYKSIEGAGIQTNDIAFSSVLDLLQALVGARRICERTGLTCTCSARGSSVFRSPWVGKPVPGNCFKFVLLDDRIDLAFLQAAGTSPPSVATFRQEDALLGESIIVFGFPLAGLLSSAGNVTTGTVSATSG